MDLEREHQKRFVFGYEEALGYTVGDLVRDKDGISAALLFAELWAVRRAAGQTLFQELETIARRHGFFLSGQLSVTMKGSDGLEKIKAIMDKLRASPPSEIGGIAVVSHSDVKTGKGTRNGKPFAVTLPSSDVLIDELEDQSRVIARPSGTEPKIKIYFDVCQPVGEGEPIATAEAKATEKLELLKKAFAKLAGI
jgi:phosphomannomutase